MKNIFMYVFKQKTLKHIFMFKKVAFKHSFPTKQVYTKVYIRPTGNTKNINFVYFRIKLMGPTLIVDFSTFITIYSS